MKLVTLHADYIKIEPKKKAIKDAEKISKDLIEVQECLVVFTAFEKSDEANVGLVEKRYVHEIEDIANQVKTKTIVLYPYVHLTHAPGNPLAALKLLDFADEQLAKKFKVFRAPFGWYKAFELKCKGHPLSELSRTFTADEQIVAEKTEKAKPEEKFSVNSKKLSEAEHLNATLSFILMKALKDLYPEAQPGIFGFHNDQVYVDLGHLRLSNEDIPRIEKKVMEIIKQNLPIKETKTISGELQLEISKDLGKVKQGYQLDTVTLVPLFKKPFLASTKTVGAFRVLSLASAYWKNTSANQQLTRIYAIAFKTRAELEHYLQQQQEAEQRDHKKIGKEFELFMQSDLVGKGLPIWLPKGDIIKREIEQFAVEQEAKAGYVRVATPHLAKKELFEQSGHLPYYKDTMYPPMIMDDGTYYLKAMNCPFHHLIYKNKMRSYRELPLRIAEYGTCYRNELSGTLSGLLRVRMLSMNDAHIYCSKDQIEQEFEGVISLILYYYTVFGLKGFWFRLSLGDRENKEKYINEPENWEFSEEILRKVLRKLNVDFVEARDEAAFYGPKIDIQYKALSGREETLSTIQLDFAAKKRFELSYQDAQGKENKEIYVIHRAPLSVHERFIAFLIEHYAGKFPLWLSPVQVRIVTVTDRNIAYAKEMVSQLKAKGIRAELDERTETMGKKVRDAQLEKINYIVTVGDKEVEGKTLAVRSRAGKVDFGVKPETFIAQLVDEIQNKKIT